MNKYDLEHKLLNGSVIYLDDIPTYSVTLGQMADFKYGYSMFQQLVSILCMDDDKAKEVLVETAEPLTWNFIIAKLYYELSIIQKNTIGDNDIDYFFIVILPHFLEIIFKETVAFDIENKCFSIGDKTHTLNKTNFDKFRNILKQRNCLTDVDDLYEMNDNPANDMAKKLLDKRKKLRDKVKQLKKTNSNEDCLTIADLISIFAEAEHIPLNYIYKNYDLYQFNNQFNRLKIMENYQINIRALLAGAKRDDRNLQHWISKIKKQDD